MLQWNKDLEFRLCGTHQGLSAVLKTSRSWFLEQPHSKNPGMTGIHFLLCVWNWDFALTGSSCGCGYNPRIIRGGAPILPTSTGMTCPAEIKDVIFIFDALSFAQGPELVGSCDLTKAKLRNAEKMLYPEMPLKSHKRGKQIWVRGRHLRGEKNPLPAVDFFWKNQPI